MLFTAGYVTRAVFGLRVPRFRANRARSTENS